MPVTITEALRLAAASEPLLIVGILLRDHRRSRVTAASSLLAACVACYLAAALYFDDTSQPRAFTVLSSGARAAL